MSQTPEVWDTLKKQLLKSPVVLCEYPCNFDNELFIVSSLVSISVSVEIMVRDTDGSKGDRLFPVASPRFISTDIRFVL